MPASVAMHRMMHTDLLDQTIPIDDEHATQTDTFFFDKHTIVAADLVIRITQQWNIDVT